MENAPDVAQNRVIAIGDLAETLDLRHAHSLG